MVKWLSIDTENMRETTQYFFNDLRKIGGTFISFSSKGGNKIYIKISDNMYQKLDSSWYRAYPIFANILTSKPNVSDYDILEDMSSDDVYDIDNDFSKVMDVKTKTYKENPLRKIARDNGISEPKFLQFMARRFPTNSDLNYADEWAKRIRNGTGHIYGDSKTREALKKSGLIYSSKKFSDKIMALSKFLGINSENIKEYPYENSLRESDIIYTFNNHEWRVLTNSEANIAVIEAKKELEENLGYKEDYNGSKERGDFLSSNMQQEEKIKYNNKMYYIYILD